MELAQATREKLRMVDQLETSCNKNSFLGLIEPEILEKTLFNHKKTTIMSKARALLYPIQRHVPFSISVLEALASGCAVFATPYGSIPEQVSPDVGTMSNSARELLYQIQHFSYNSNRCRSFALEKFNYILMTKKYLKFYETILNHKSLLKEETGVKTSIQPKLHSEWIRTEPLPYEFLSPDA